MQPYRALSTALPFLLSAACGAGGRPVSVMPTECPDWVFRGSGAMADGGKQAFYGVGAVRGIKNRPLAITTAENRARAELGRVVKTYTASLMKDYMAATSAGGEASAEEQHVEQAIKTFSATVLSGVSFPERWFAPDGTIYALARIDLASVKDSLAKTEAFDAAAREQASARADEAYQQQAAPEPPPPPPAPETCQLELKVQQVGRSAEGCYVDEKVANTIGLLSYPCAGGQATVSFGAVVFSGTVTPEAADLQLRTEYVYERYDKCTWWSEQKISGALGTGKLRYDYGEGRVAGQTGCNMNAVPCTADGDVLLRRVSQQ